MKQIVQSNKSGELSLQESPVPALLSGGVLVETLFSAVSVGTEGMKVRTARQSLVGKARSRPDLVRQVLQTYKKEGAANTYRKIMNRLETPVPLGYSLAGRVVDVSPDIDDFHVGDLVSCGGAGFANHAEFAFVPRNLCAKVPDGVPLEQAAFGTIASIALHGVRQANVQVGESIAVIGQGLVGLLAVQMLSASGARVFGIDLSQSRVDLAKTLGAIDGATVGSAGFDLRVSGFTGGAGFDTVVVAAADSSSRATGLAAKIARDRGRVVVLGIVGMELEHKLFYDKELELKMSRSYGPGRYDTSYEEGGQDYPFSYVRWTEQRNLASVLELMRSKRLVLDPLITHRFPFDRAPEAYGMLAGPEAGSILGIVFDYGSGGKTRTTKVELRTGAPAAKGDGALRVSFVGAGNFAKSTLIPAFKSATTVSLAAVATSTSIGSRHTASKLGFDTASTAATEVITDATTDLVVIATRHDLHAPLTIQALDAGKAVFVEKPLALNEAEFADVVQALQRSPKPFLHVGFNRRFAPLVVSARAFLPASGPYSMLYRVNAGPVPREHWYHDATQGGGRLIGEGCHFIDLLQAIAGAPPVRVSADAMADAGMYRGDNVFVTVTFADGSVGSVIYLACNDTALPKERLEVSAGGVSIVLDDFRELTMSRGGKVKTEKSRLGQDKGHAAQVKAVVDALRAGKPAPIPLDQLLASSLATLAAKRSIEWRAAIDLDLSTFTLAARS